MANIFIYDNEAVVSYDIQDNEGTIKEIASLLNAKSITTTMVGDYTIIDGGEPKAEDGLYFTSGFSLTLNNAVRFLTIALETTEKFWSKKATLLSM